MQKNNAKNTPASQQVSRIGAAGKGHAPTLRGIGIGTRLIDDDPDGPEVPPIAPSSTRTSENGARYAVWYLDQPCDPNALDGLATLFHQDQPERAYALPPEEWPETSYGPRCTVQQLLEGFGVSNVEVLPVKAKVAKPAWRVTIPPSTSAPIKTIVRHNDAIVHGDLDPALLDREIEIGLSKAGQRTMPGRWKNATMTVGALVDVLSRHKEGSKDGECILQGAVIDGERRANAIRHLDLLMLDLDTGETLEDVVARIEALGLFAVIWTTHSHLKPISEVKKDEVLRFTEDTSGSPDVDQVRAYFMQKKRYRPAILEGAKLLEAEHTKDGVMCRLEHQPMPKFRVLLVLDKRFVIAERAASQKAAITEWKERYAGASKMLGAFFDRSCVDPSRLMFTPRHPKGAPFELHIIAGKPLDIDTCERVTAEELKAGGATPWDAAAKGLGAGSGTDNYQTTSLRWFFGKYGDRFEIDDFLLEMDPDGDRGPRSSGPGRTHCCPNDDAHSDAGNPEDKGFFCVNASEAESGKATARCSHDACQDVDRIGFVDLICAREGIKDASELKRWVAEIEGDDEEEAAKESVSFPAGYQNQNGRLCFTEWNADKPKTFELCNAIEVRGRIRNENQNGWGTLIAFKRDNGSECEAIVSDAEMLSDSGSLIARLGDEGARVDGTSRSKAQLMTFFSRVKTDVEIIAVTRPGWHGETYVSPLGEAIGPDAARMRLAKDAGANDKVKGGTLRGWKDAIAAACGVRQNPYWALGVMAGFAGCVIDLLGWDSLGLNYTGQTSTGKSTAQGLQASVSSNPTRTKGVFDNFKATGNSIENLVIVGTGSSCALDELGNVEVKDVSKAIFLLAGDAPKARQNRDGSLRKRVGWRTFWTTSGEMSIRQMIEEARERYREGISTRVLDLSTVDGVTVSATKMREIERYKQNYGWALPAFVRHLQTEGYATDTDKLADKISRFSVDIAGPNALSKLRRAARIPALLMVCGLLGKRPVSGV